MNTRNRRREYHKWGSELRVREVIMPVKSDEKDAGPSKDVTNFKKDFECRNITGSSMALGEKEIPAFCGLVVLKKQPVEEYDVGTKQKKCRIRKAKWNRNYTSTNSTLCNLLLQTNETVHPKSETERNLPQTAEAIEEKIVEANIQKKIENYEKWMKQQEERNYRRQRYLEKESLKQQENLAKTWLGFIQSKKELRKKNLEQGVLPSLCRHLGDRQVNISLISKKHWNDESDEKTPKNPPKVEKDKVTKSSPVALDELKNDFFQKLVFVDDSDDDLG